MPPLKAISAEGQAHVRWAFEGLTGRADAGPALTARTPEWEALGRDNPAGCSDKSATGLNRKTLGRRSRPGVFLIGIQSENYTVGPTESESRTMRPGHAVMACHFRNQIRKRGVNKARVDHGVIGEEKLISKLPCKPTSPYDYSYRGKFREFLRKLAGFMASKSLVHVEGSLVREINLGNPYNPNSSRYYHHRGEISGISRKVCRFRCPQNVSTCEGENSGKNMAGFGPVGTLVYVKGKRICS